MQDLVVLALTYLRMIWRYRWLALVGASLICAGGWAAVMTLPDVYEVRTKIFLDTQSMLRPLLKGLAVDSTATQDAQLLMRRTLLVRPNLEAVARKTDMDLTAKTPEQFEALLDRLAADIQVAGTGKTNIYNITYRDSDPKLATRVVEALLNIFVEKSLGETRKDTSQTRNFLAKQIEEYAARLEAAEQRLKEFKQRNLGMLPQDGRGHMARLDETQRQLEEARLKLREAQNRRDQVEAQLENVDRMFVVPVQPEPSALAAPPSPLDLRIRSLQSKLDELLLQFTDSHPDVVAIRRVIEQLEAEKAEAEADAASAAASAAAEQQAAAAESEAAGEQAPVSRQQLENPIFQQLKVALGTEEGAVAAAEARVAEFENRAERAQELVESTLNVEAELKRLDRDYSVNRRNYEELIKRREALNIANEVSQTTDEVRFNILEPPRVPLSPIAPDRKVLNAMVLVSGLGAGVGLALLVALLRPSVYSREGLSELTQREVLGVVSRIWTRREQFRRRFEVASFALGCMCLFALYGALVVVQELDVDIVARATRLAKSIL